MSDRYLLRAFKEGCKAGNRDQPRRKCPYLPSTQEAKWQAWMCGYEEANPTYEIVNNSPKS